MRLDMRPIDAEDRGAIVGEEKRCKGDCTASLAIVIFGQSLEISSYLGLSLPAQPLEGKRVEEERRPLA